MGLIRFLFFVVIIAVLWFMVKNYARKQELREERRRNEKTRLMTGKIVRCKQCDVHLPEQDAVQDGDDRFCSQAHRQAWLTNNTSKS